jgi:hypothetical protein
MEQEEYFRVNRAWNGMDGGVGREHASCCGVNLAFAALGVLVWLRDAAGKGVGFFHKL